LKYLLYCIFTGRKVPMADRLTGVDDRPVVQVSNNGLVAAVSRIVREDIKSDVPLIMAYKKVIDSFHRERTVIPMRYGCLLKEKKQVAQLLEKNRSQYETLLKKLDGCVEMGIRVLIVDCQSSIEDLRNSELENSDPQSATESFKIQNPCPPSRAFKRGGRSKSKMLGRDYLTSRKAHYEQKDKLGKEIETLTEQYRKAFSGLYVKFKAEHPAAGNLQSSILPRSISAVAEPLCGFNRSVNRQSQTPNPLVSLYFLVPRQSVERFRQVFRHICRGQNVKLLMSGPWPPYNFVTPCNGEDTL
jgi:hypothetical protein